MTLKTIAEYFVNYGGIAIFVIVLLEYLNLPVSMFGFRLYQKLTRG